MKTLAHIKDVVSRITVKNGMTVVVALDNVRPFLQVGFWAPCNTNGGSPKFQTGRKWFLSYYMTDSEIVGTALKAVLTAVEHETREQFLYRGHAIYAPHYNVEALVALSASMEPDARAA